MPALKQVGELDSGSLLRSGARLVDESEGKKRTAYANFDRILQQSAKNNAALSKALLGVLNAVTRKPGSSTIITAANCHTSPVSQPLLAASGPQVSPLQPPVRALQDAREKIAVIGEAAAQFAKQHSAELEETRGCPEFV